MSKIFSADFRKGSFIDSVNKIVGVPTSLSKLIRTEKGTALARVINHNGVTYTTGSKSLSKFTIVAWIKQRTTDTEDRYSIARIGNAQIIRRENSATNYSNYFDGSILGSLSVPTSTSLNKWMQFVVTYDGASLISSINNKQLVGSPSSTTATLDCTSITIGRGSSASRYSDSDILKFEVYDDVISDKELELDYKSLLESQVTEKPIRGFELVKPTDLSYEKDRGLFAAYNMKPNGSTLVDISGNSRHGTLNGGVINTKEGLGFNGVNGYIGSITSPTYTDKLSVSVRFKPTDDTYVGYKGVIGDWNLTGDKRSWFIAKETGAGNKYEFDISTNGKWVSGRSIATDEALTKNLWYTLTAVYNGAKIYMYLNGVKQTAERNVTGNLFQGDLLQIGIYNSDLTRCFPGEIQDVRIYNRELTEQEVKDYHNSFISPVILEDFNNYSVGETRPKEWQIISGEFEIKEDTEKKYLECTSTGTIKINHNTTTDADASIDYYDGASWTTFSGTLRDLITTHAWLSKDGNYLEFSLTSGKAIAKIKIYDGVRQ